MSVLSYEEFTSQQSSGKVPPSEVSQFKAPLRLQSGVQSGKLPAQDQRYSTPGSTSSKGVAQFKAPLGLQSGKLLAQSQPYSASGTPSFNGTPLFPVTNPSQSVVQQPEMRIGQSGYYSPSEMHLSNAPLQPAWPTMSLPRVLGLPSFGTRNAYSVGVPITEKSSVFPIRSNKVSTDPYVGIPATSSRLEALRQRRASQFLRESDRSWRPPLPRTEAQVRSEALHRIKIPVTIKVILMAGTALLLGGIASFLLLRFPTYLVVTWAILIIVFSNLVSRELRSYYKLTPTTLNMEAVHPSTVSTPQGEDTGRHPMLKDISGTTDYLKALCLVFKNDQPTQTYPPEKEYRV